MLKKKAEMTREVESGADEAPRFDSGAETDNSASSLGDLRPAEYTEE